MLGLIPGLGGERKEGDDSGGGATTTCGICLERFPQSELAAPPCPSPSCRDEVRLCRPCLRAAFRTATNDWRILTPVKCPGACGAVLPFCDWRDCVTEEDAQGFQTLLLSRSAIRCPECHKNRVFGGCAEFDLNINERYTLSWDSGAWDSGDGRGDSNRIRGVVEEKTPSQ